MMINAIAPYQLGKALLPRLGEGARCSRSPAAWAASARMAAAVPYRTSKAALNMAWSCLALRRSRTASPASLLSPGWVKTRHGRRGRGDHDGGKRERHARAIDRLTIADTGQFLRRNGSDTALVGCLAALSASIGARFPDRWKTNGPAKRHAVAVG